MLPPAIDDSAEFEAICALVEDRYGVVIPGERREIVRDELRTGSREHGVSGIHDVRDGVLRGDANAVRFLLDTVTVNHTHFFREMGAYRLFLDRLVPKMQATRGDVRIWSAACSTGEELYSLAILLCEQVGIDEMRQHWRLLGTDIDAVSVEHAEQGVYDEQRVSTIDPVLRQRYFTPAPGGKHQVRRDVRNLCTFRRLNLVEHPYPFQHRFNAIFCRNVLYYFAEERQQAVLRSLHDVTCPGGWLITGVSDSVRQLTSPWVSQSSIFHERQTS